jgi:hypothetical protein
VIKLSQPEAHGEIKPFHSNNGRLARRTPLPEPRTFVLPIEGREAALIFQLSLVM